METAKRNYSVAGPESRRALEKGLIDAQWYTPYVSRAMMKELMVRRDALALRDTLLWLLLLGATGRLGLVTWGSWWAVPVFFAYGIVYTVPAVSKWHEFSHGTPFKTLWANELMYYICSYMIAISGVDYRWGHVKHHTNTIIVGGDPQVDHPRPAEWKFIILRFVTLVYMFRAFKNMFRHSMGLLNDNQKVYIPVSERKKLFWEARIWVILYLCLGVISYAVGSLLPFMYVGLIPFLLGMPFNYMLIMTQHGGLAEDVLDHRLNTRTFYTHRLLRFLYSDMNYHLEHHIFPSVPYYHLAKLHELIKDQCPPAYPSMSACFKETVKALWRQRKEHNYYEVRPLPHDASRGKEFN